MDRPFLRVQSDASVASVVPCIDTKPEFPLQDKGILDNMNDDHIFIGSELSYFSAKVRSYLEWKGIPFKQALPSKKVFQEIILPLTGVAFIPILVLPTSPPTAIQDSRQIIRYVEETFRNDRHPVISRKPRLAFVAALIEILVDQWLSIQGKYWMAGKGAFEEQKTWVFVELGDMLLGGEKASAEEKEAAGRQPWPTDFATEGITEETVPAIREQFLTILGHLSDHFARYRFVLGDRITLADFSLYATIYVHLYRNPVPGYILKTRFPLVAEWVERVSGLGRAGSAHGNVVKLDEGKWVVDYPTDEDEDIPATIKPLLSLLLKDYIPLLSDTVAKVADFLDEKRGEPAPQNNQWQLLPRSIGEHEFQLHSGRSELVGKGRRTINTHGAWMLQEVISGQYHGMEDLCDQVIRELVGTDVAENSWKACVDVVNKGEWVLEREGNVLVGKPNKNGEST